LPDKSLHLSFLFIQCRRLHLGQFPHFFIIAIQRLPVKTDIIKDLLIIVIGNNNFFQATVFLAGLGKFFIVTNNGRVGKGYSQLVKPCFYGFQTIKHTVINRK